MDIRKGLQLVVSGENLSEQQMQEVMNSIMSGEATDAQIGAFITALRIKGETVEEIVGAVRVMRQKATFVDSGVDTTAGGILLDIVGTGGDGSGTFNVSTTTSFIVAAAGIPIAKHGNRAVSSNCGSADVLEALGVDLSLPPATVGKCVQQVGMGFLFAPMLHGAMKYAIGPRREMGIRTIFNILGPMTNPAGANVQLTGVFSKELTTVMAEVLSRMGMRRVMVVWGEGNLDEMTVTGTTHIAEAEAGKVTNYTIEPEDFGLTRAGLDALRGGTTVEESADQLRAILSGETGPKRDMVLLNSAGALKVAGKTATIDEGIQLAAEIIDSGKAKDKLDQLVDFCRAS